MTPVFPLAYGTWGDEERVALEEVIESGRFTMGERVRAFERKLADVVGSRHCVMVNSGSSANLLMAAALRFRSVAPVAPGAEVIVPAVGWATTYFPFAQLGYRLRFVDVDPGTLNLDPARLAAAITPDTAAVAIVNVLGNPCDIDAIEAVLAAAQAEHGRPIHLLEDSCESLGATAGGRRSGTDGLMGTFSFFYSHHISTMEGGAVVTDDDELAEILVSLRAHGWTRDLPPTSGLAVPDDDPFEAAFRFVLPGFNVRPLELCAAVGLVQLDRLPALLAARRANAARFLEQLAPLAGVLRTQVQPADGSWFGLSLIVEPDAPVDRREVVAALSAAGIASRPVIAGNFTRQPALAWIDHTVSGPLDAADLVHDRGLYVGNAGRDLAAEIDLLAETLHAVVAAGAGRRRWAA